MSREEDKAGEKGLEEATVPTGKLKGAVPKLPFPYHDFDAHYVETCMEALRLYAGRETGPKFSQVIVDAVARERAENKNKIHTLTLAMATLFGPIGPFNGDDCFGSRVCYNRIIEVAAIANALYEEAEDIVGLPEENEK